MKIKGVWFIFLSVLLTVGCASTFREGDRAFAAGAYSRAVSLYRPVAPLTEADLPEAVLFRFALARALAPAPEGDPQGAIASFQELLKRFPQSVYRPQVELVLRAYESIEAAKKQLAQAQNEVARATARINALEAEAKTRDGALDRLKSALGEAENKARRLQIELDQLKRIDLQPPRKP